MYKLLVRVIAKDDSTVSEEQFDLLTEAADYLYLLSEDIDVQTIKKIEMEVVK